MGFVKYHGALLKDEKGKFITVRISWKIFCNQEKLRHYLDQFSRAYSGTRVVFVSFDENGRRHFTGSSHDRDLIRKLGEMKEEIQLKEFEVFLEGE